MTFATECPNCGSKTPPKKVRHPWTTYYNCVRCDFSTWHLADYSPYANKPTDDEKEEK